jgi:hypothetical protein
MKDGSATAEMIEITAMITSSSRIVNPFAWALRFAAWFGSARIFDRLLPQQAPLCALLRGTQVYFSAE